MKSFLKAMTLIEVMIGIAIMLIGMEGFTLLFLRSWDTNKFVLEEGLASSAASRATNKVIIALRGIRQSENGSFPIASAADFDLTVYNDIDNDGVVERVHYYLDLDTDQMKIGIADPDMSTLPASYPASDETVAVMTNFVVNESDNPVFLYYNDDYPGDTVNNPLASPASVGSIQLVKVHFLVNIDPVHAPNNINIESFVDLRNLHNYE